MKQTKQLTIITIIILFSLISSAIMPTNVLADDSTPPPAETQVAPQPTDPPVVKDISTEPPVVATDAPTESPVVQETASPDPAATEVAATQAPGSEESYC